MNLIFLISILLKGVGAVLEILLQITITRGIGVSGYGTYTTWINAADLIFWCLFSGIVKCNTFYLSGKNRTLVKFKNKYYVRYVIPITGCICLAAWAAGRKEYLMIAVIAFAELLMLDQSSSFLAEGNYISSLTGEYVLGRMFLLVSVFILQSTGRFSLNATVVLYLAQYILVVVFFLVVGKKKRRRDLNKNQPDQVRKVSVRKLLQYQRADIMQAMIGQMPVILQYILAGAFEAGVVGIVLLVKKLINFISGPAAKVFLPEFSRLYHKDDRKGLRDSFSSIMRIQMLFAGPLAVVLAGYPEVVLRILAEELIPYTGLFMGCSLIFIIAATLGPCGGLMQMTGNERLDNRCREAAVLFMLIIFVLMRRDPLFALYGLAAQTLTESVSKYIFVCRWLEKEPVRLSTYLRWWILPAAAIGVSRFMQWQDSFTMMFITAVIVFSIQFAVELKKEGGLLQMLKQRRSFNEQKDTDD
ncbi:hypothetical protein H6B11_04265 [Mediterraneibacter glycyrrhizinilyticus]|nr:hypothetical protein [Mediterraneibacter glycyrrhizinilyticus]MBM6853381.1 hypothetical protein [Mediterraneibacter glycyrrhizinilyticus]